MKDFLFRLYHVLGSLVLLLVSGGVGWFLARWCLPTSAYAPLFGAALLVGIYMIGVQCWMGALTAIAGKALAKGVLRGIVQGVWNFLFRRSEKKIKTLLTDVQERIDLDQATIDAEYPKAALVFRNLGVSLGAAGGMLIGLIGLYDPQTRLALTPVQLAFLERYLDTAFWLAFPTTHVTLSLIFFAAVGWGYGWLLVGLARRGWLPMLLT